MSIINQMLQKVEAERGAESRASGLPPKVRPIDTPPRTGISKWLFPAAFVLALLTAAIYLKKPKTAAPSPKAAPIESTPFKAAPNAAPPPPVEIPLELSTTLLTNPAASGEVEKKKSPDAPKPAKPQALATGNSVSKEILPEQQADHLYRKAISSIQQGRIAEAEADLLDALRANPNEQNARQALAGLLLEQKRYEDAERLLRDGLVLSPKQTGFAMALARLQVEMGKTGAAMTTLKNVEPYASGDPDFCGFTAILLQRSENHSEAIRYFRKALSLKPSMGNWWVGLGISLAKNQQSDEAVAAFRRAKSQDNLSPELRNFAETQISVLEHQSARQ